jgi:hypothetical protein
MDIRFRFIEDRCADYPLTGRCDVLAVSQVGYYACRHRPPIVALVEDIKRVYRDTKRPYGRPHPCRAEGSVPGVSRGRIERLMGRHGIRHLGRPRRVRTTDSRHDFPIAPCLSAPSLSPRGMDLCRCSSGRGRAPNDGGIYVFGRI